MFYTDGFTERETSSAEMYGVERLMAGLERNAQGGPESLIRGAVVDVESFAAGCQPSDDQTILIASMS